MTLKWQVFCTASDVMETLYNVLITLLFCLLKTLLERFPRHSEDVLYLNTQLEPAESAY